MRPKGFKMSEESKKKISETHKRIGFKPKTCHLKGEESCSYGRKWNENRRKKFGEYNKLLNRKPPSRKGAKHSQETKNKMSIARQKENSPFWQGGKSYEPYSLDWTRTLRRSIRERDNYTCQICSRQQEDFAFDVHHKDFDKNNCNPNNLITLCKSCHSKIGYYEKRILWQNKL
jgi:5-methylcytosine-specific restriction endonuclease McrA